MPGELPAASRGMRGGLVAPGPSRKVQGQPEKRPICRAPRHMGPLAQPHRPAGARSAPQPPAQTERWGKILLGPQVWLPWCAPAMPKSALGRERASPSPAFASSSPLGAPDQTKILVFFFFFWLVFVVFLFFDFCFFSQHQLTACAALCGAGLGGVAGRVTVAMAVGSGEARAEPCLVLQGGKGRQGGWRMENQEWHWGAQGWAGCRKRRGTAG